MNSMAVSVHIRPEVQQVFRTQGLGTFNDFMSVDTGGGLNDGGRCDVQLLAMEDGARFYVKKSDRVALAVQLRLLLFGRTACGPLREKKLLDGLRRAGFSAMEPVAWGEKRFFGLPIAGFLVVREVVGRIVADWHQQAADCERRRIMEQVGELLGRLHAHGFYQPVRLKDLIFDGSNMVLIDRETSKPWMSRFSLRKSEQMVVRSIRRTVRGGFDIGAGSANAFLRGYVRALNARCRIERLAFRRRIIKRLRREWEVRRADTVQSSVSPSSVTA